MTSRTSTFLTVTFVLAFAASPAFSKEKEPTCPQYCSGATQSTCIDREGQCIVVTDPSSYKIPNPFNINNVPCCPNGYTAEECHTWCDTNFFTPCNDSCN